MTSRSNFLSPGDGIVEEEGESDDITMRDTTVNTIVAPSGKYKRTPSIPVDMLETRSSPSVVELDLLRKKRQQENQVELVRGRDFFPGDMIIGFDYKNNIEPVLRMRQSPPVFQSFSRKSLRSGLILPMRRNVLSPPKILIGRGMCQLDDDRFSEMMMMSPDSDDFLLRCPNQASDNAKFFTTADTQDFENHSGDDFGARTRRESLDDLCIPSSSAGLDCPKDDVLRCRSTSPIYSSHEKSESLFHKSKITLKPKLRKIQHSSPNTPRQDVMRRRGSPLNLSSLQISKDSPIKPRARHFQPTAFPVVPSSFLLDSHVEPLTKEENLNPTSFLNEASPFRLVHHDSFNVTDIHPRFETMPPIESTPSCQHTPFRRSVDVNSNLLRPTVLFAAETPWFLDAWRSSNDTSAVGNYYENVSASANFGIRMPDSATPVMASSSPVLSDTSST